MSDLNKTMKCLRLLMLLYSPYRRTFEEIEENLSINKRTLYRYLNELKSFGLEIKTKSKEIYLEKDTAVPLLLKKVFAFSAHEALLLSNSISAIDAPMPVKNGLKQKLGFFAENKLHNELVKSQDSEIVIQINNAIKTTEKVLFRNYASSNSGKVSDRMVEPYEFKNNFQYVMSFDCEDKKNKLFKISRITQVDSVSVKWEYEDKHKSLPTDAFRICGELNKHVELELTLLAKNLLVEEFPYAEQYVKKLEPNKYLFSGNVAGFQGIGRFCLGLPDQVCVRESDELKAYIRCRAEQAKEIVQ